MSTPLFSLPTESDSRKKKFSTTMLVLRITLPVIIFFISVWLIFSKFQKTPAEKIEQALQEKDFLHAQKLITRYIEKEKLSRLRLLMYGTIVQFGLQEKNSLPAEIPDYQEMLIQEDSALIFLKESYLRRMEMFPYSERFLQLTCSFVDLFPSVYLTDETQKLFARGIESMGNWKPVNRHCLALIFDEAIPFFHRYLRMVNASDVNFRKDPDTESFIINKLNAGEKVLTRKKGPALTVGKQSGYWQFIFTKEQKQGWVFDHYLSNLPALEYGQE